MGDHKDVGWAGEGPEVKINAGDEAVDIEFEQNPGQTEDLNDLTHIICSFLYKKTLNQPKSVKRNVKALKKLQLAHMNMEVEFFKEVFELKIKYEKKFEPLYLKQAAIITSSIIPTDKDIFQLDSEKEAELSKVKVEGDTEARMDIPEAEIKGIPGFWLTALKNAPLVADFIEEYDEPILKHLKDIKAVTLSNPMSFYLEFQFEPNDYFTNTVLTKSYALKCVPDSKNIFSFKGPEIVTCKGCKIHWKKFKNVTAETKKKKARKAFRTITKYDETASFFNFFNPPPVQENDDQMDDETIKILNNDFDLSIAIKDHLIPNALLFFTGGKVVDDEVNVKAME